MVVVAIVAVAVVMEVVVGVLKKITSQIKMKGRK